MPKTPSTGTYRFEGFVTPRYTPTPDQLFDKLLAPGLLTEAELRVLLYPKFCATGGQITFR